MCWVGAIVSLEWTLENPWNLSRDLLFWSKNRWQDGYGLALRLENWEIKVFKFQDINDDLVSRVNDFSWRVTSIITHARYPTSGWKDYNPQYVQPFEEKEANSRYTFAFNGNIVNAPKIAGELSVKWLHLTQNPLLDTEVLKLMIQEQFNAWVTDHRMILEHINNQIDGCCNIILLSEDGSLSFAKDRWWFRPLAFAHDWKTLVASSESSVLFKMWFSDYSFVKTGDIVQYTPKTKKVSHFPMKLDVPIQKSRCFFEAVYFAHPMTLLWWTPSNSHRYRLGQVLAKSDENNSFDSSDTVVVDVPASAHYSARWYKDVFQLDLIPAITKSPHAKRTFIEQSWKRWDMIQEKYIFNPNLISFIKWKKVVLMDDSIVRWATMSYLVKAFRDFYQPSEVHLRIPSPPIVAPCFYGINMAKIDELVASEYFKDILHPTENELQKLAQFLNADSVKYISHSWLIEALKVDVSDICMWCITGKYPTLCWQTEYDKQVSI